MTATKLPVTILAGYLGAGKTTLVNALLSGDHGQKITVMVNDFGAVNIDADLIIRRNQQIMELSNGCVCCSLQGDMVAQLQSFFENIGDTDHLLIEASGVSQPSRIASVFGYPDFRCKARLDAVITLLDTANVNGLPPASRRLVLDQIEAADLVLLTKTDLTPVENIKTIRNEFLLPDQPSLDVVRGNVPAAVLLGLGGDGTRHFGDSDLDHGPTFSAEIWRSKAPIGISAFREVMAQHGNAAYRVKGFLHCKEHPDQRVLYQKVGARQSFDFAGPWRDNEPANHLALIGEGQAKAIDRLIVELDATSGCATADT